MQFLRSYCIHKSFDIGLYWKFKKVTQRSASNLAEIILRRTSLPVKLQHDAGTFWGIIIFTRSCKMLPLEHDLVKKGQAKVNIELVQEFDVENISVKLWNDTGNSCSYLVHKAAWHWASLKVRKGHTKINIELIRDFDIVNTAIMLQLDKAIYEELSHSQGPATCCMLESIKRSYKGQDQTWLKFWWVEDHSLYSYNMTQANSNALSYSQGAARCCHLNMT